MKSPIFFFMLVILSAIASAETKLFSGDLITGTDKVIDGKTFKFIYDAQSDKVFAQTPATNLIIENGQCKSNNLFNICINKANFSHKDMATYVYYYKLNVDINQIGGSLSASVKATPSEILQGESSDLKIILTNQNDFEIKGIQFEYSAPDFFIKDVAGCFLDINNIKWSGSLKPKEDKTCTATIVAEKEGTHNLAGKLKYFNLYGNESKAIEPVSIIVLPKQLKFKQTIDKNIKVKQPFYLNISLENTHKTEDMKIDVTFDIPRNIVVRKDFPSLENNFNVLRRKSTLKPGAIENYSLYLDVQSEEEYTITKRFAYVIMGVEDAIEDKTLIGLLEQKPIIDFTSESAEVSPGQKFNVIAKIKNPSLIYEMKDINADLYATYNNKTGQKLSKLNPGQEYAIINNTLTAPSNEDLAKSGNKTIKLKLNIEYNSKNATKSLESTLELKIIQEASNKTAAVIETKNQSVNKTSEAFAIKDLPKQKPKQGFFNKEILFFIIMVLASFLAVFFVIINVKRRKKGGIDYEKFLKEIEEGRS